MKPIIINERHAVKHVEVAEEYTEEKIREIFSGDDECLVMQLLNRCCDQEKEIDRLRNTLTEIKTALIAYRDNDDAVVLDVGSLVKAIEITEEGK